MVFVVDTNILCYAANADSPFHAQSRALLEAWKAEAFPWHITWGIAYEFLRFTTHARVLSRPFEPAEAWLFIDNILNMPGVAPLLPTKRHRAVAAQVFAETPSIQGNLVFDAQTAILMREHGIETIYTHDTDFHRFTFLNVVDPIEEEQRY